MDLKSGTRLGPYEIVSPIGAGGMGQVYRAIDTRLGRTVAIKILPEAFANDATRRMRFQREAKAISSLNHPHICTLFDVGDSYLVMEYCEGMTLADRITVSPLDLDDVVQYGIQIADALQNAHRQGIVHRDLKPSNIMITPAGVKLLDFGLAKRQLETAIDATTAVAMSADQKMIGTVPYMAPEVLRGKPADVRSDIFAVGLILYEMVTGRRAFDGTSTASVVAAILEHEPPPISDFNRSTPEALESFIRACIIKDPEERVQTANDVRRHLRAISDGRPKRVSGRAPRMHRRVATALAAFVIAATAGVLAWNNRGAPADGAIASLVVLPFQNNSKPDDEFLVAGMHDGVIGELSQISGLRVISRTSSLHYQGSRKAVPEIAQELNIDAIVEGSVLRTGNGVRLQVKLVRGRPDERQVWSQTYERRMDDVLSIQRDVARAIATSGNVSLTAAENARLSTRHRVSPQTYEAYLKGMFHVRKLTADSSKKGIEYLQQAVASDPTDPLAYGGLALAYSTIGHSPAALPDTFALAASAARKAIELDDTRPEPHAALGGIALYHDWEWETARRELQRAMELDPNFAQAHRDNAWLQQLNGRNDDALAEMKRAKELDPLTPLYSRELGWIYRSVGRIDDAIREGRNAVELDPSLGIGHRFLAQALSEKGMHAEAIGEAEKAAALQPVFKYAVAYVYANAGRRADAEKIIAEIEASKPMPIFGWGLAEAHAALGHKDQALRWLEKGMESRFPWMISIADNPAMASLHDDPRFQALVRRLNLPRDR